LLHVEGTPENLYVTQFVIVICSHDRASYFHLWVRHYRRLHREWAESVLPAANIPGSSKGMYRSRDLWERLCLCQDRQLKDEFAFAKAKFLEEDAPMKLGINEDLRRKVLFISNLLPQSQGTRAMQSIPSRAHTARFQP
jgi:hypothetical protein